MHLERDASERLHGLEALADLMNGQGVGSAEDDVGMGDRQLVRTY